jgi:hypothetical protein
MAGFVERMISGKKLGLVALVLLGIYKLVNGGGTSDGWIDIMNYTTTRLEGGVQHVTMIDNYDDVRYLDNPPGPALLAYIYDPNSPDGPYLSGKGINQQNTNVVKIWFDSRAGVPTNINHFIRLRIGSMFGLPADMNDYAFRNITLHQDPSNANADPNLYDIKDLTNYGTALGYINFPTFEPAQFIFRADNYADLTFNGKADLEDCAVWADSWLRNDCNSTNHWCNFADLDRDGDVDFKDYSLVGNEFGYDSNDPNTW